MSEAESRILDALYRGVTDGDRFAEALKLIQDTFECRAAVLVSVRARDPMASFITTSGILKDYLQLYNEKYATMDPVRR